MKILLSFALGFLLIGCGGSKPKPAPLLPLSHQVTFIESSSSAEVMLRAQGEGEKLSYAKIDAKKAALWFVLFGGDNPMLQTLEEKDAFKGIEKEFYKRVNSFITYDSGIKSKKKSGEIYYVEHVLRVNVAMLREYLEQKNILKPIEEILDRTPMPTIALMAKGSEAQIGANVISSYLHDKDFEVLRVDKSSAGKVFFKVAQNISVDPIAAEMYASALSSGSDVYIRINAQTSSRTLASKELKKASVTLYAYYTASAKEIAAVNAYSEERVVSSYDSLIAEAANDGANKLLSQIQKSWKKESKRGKYFKVIATTSEEMVRDVDLPLYKALKKSCESVKPNNFIGNIFDYTLQCKDITNFKELEMNIISHYIGAGEIRSEAAKGSFLILKIANSESDEIEIE